MGILNKNFKHYGTPWGVVDSERFDEEDLSVIKKVEIVKSTYGKSAKIYISATEFLFIPVDKRDELHAIGDLVDPRTCVLKQLHKEGEEDIFRISFTD